MRLRGSAWLLAVALFASLLSPVVLRTPPAMATHTSCTPNADDTTADYYPGTSPWSDGVKVRFRVLRPVNCSGKPTNGWPLIVHLHGGSGNRCYDMPFYSRYQTAQDGYVVLSFTARGKPGPLTVGAPSKGCDDTQDGTDALDDPGSGAPESRDLKDISQLIDWINSNNSFSGCSNPCADTNKVGVTGFSWGGPRTLWMGVEGPPGHATHPGPNPDFDDRVKAIAPVASQVLWRTLVNQNNDGAATPAARDRAEGTWGNIAWWFNQGWFGRWTRDYSKHAGELDRTGYLNETTPDVNTNGSMTNGSAVLTISGSPSFTSGDVGSLVTVADAGGTGVTLLGTVSSYTSATQVTLATTAKATVSGKRVSWDTQGYWDSRLLIDDNGIIDKISKIEIPTLVMTGWMDGAQGIYQNVLIDAWNKLGTPSADKYLYLGSCSHSDDPCHTNNASKMRGALHRFFTRHVRGDTGCGSNCEVRPPGTTTCAATGPCVIYTIPPKWVDVSSNAWVSDNWAETARTSWPPSDATTETRYFRNNGTLTTTSESGTTCTPGTLPAKGTGCSTFTNALNLPTIYAFCLDATYTSGGSGTEMQAWDWDFGGYGADKKIAKLEADLHVSSDTARLQVYADLWLTDSSGNDLFRIWRGQAQVAPVKRDGTAGTVYRFKFQPGSAGWTVDGAGSGTQKLRLKIASKYAQAHAGEPLPATYTLYHNGSTNPDRRSNVKLTFVS